jgi:hypothetical protein
MELLEYHLEKFPTNTHYTPRKINLPLEDNHLHHLNLYGVRGSGKSSIIADYLERCDKEHTLYIDLENPHFILYHFTPQELQHFITLHHITQLIFDHCHIDFTLPMVNVERIIVISRQPLDLEGFHPIELFPLDYEEFLAFENSTKHRGLNHFLRSGTLPFVAHYSKEQRETFKTFFQSKFTPNEQQLLLILAKHHTKHLSKHQVYQFAKEHFKISKDWLYKTLELWKQEKLIFFINDITQKSAKKMLLFDFAFAKYLTLGQPFITQFDTMIALSLTKHRIAIQTLGIHGYLTESMELILPAPFESEESIWAKSQNKFSLYKQHNIVKITIITVANSYSFSIGKLFFEALPFDEWSIISTEE